MRGGRHLSGGVGDHENGGDERWFAPPSVIRVMLRVVRGKENAKGSSIYDISREAGKRLPKFGREKEGRLREGGGVPKSRRHLWGARGPAPLVEDEDGVGRGDVMGGKGGEVMTKSALSRQSITLPPTTSSRVVSKFAMAMQFYTLPR